MKRFLIRYELTARGKFRRIVFSLQYEIIDLRPTTDALLPEYTENPSCGEKSKVGPLLGFWKNSSLREMTRLPSVCLFAPLCVTDGNDDSENM
jgi:hypothetical protein